MRKFKCSICGYVYDESVGIPEKGIAPGTKWEDIPDDFTCPMCGAPKNLFELIDEAAPSATVSINDDAVHADNTEDLKELSPGEISAICSNLARGCEKQRLTAEMEAFRKIADYFKSKAVAESGGTLDDIAKMLDDDLTNRLPAANVAAKADADRGALRSLIWSEKVSMMMKTLLDRFAKEGDKMLENTNIYVCDICGFIYIGETPPEICPVCKVPKFQIIQVERR
ncbi:MAG: rubredoxin [Oscillospiraceae bacterium]|nr:rubredoxin [Oscillospiraceae bacterium]